MSSAKSTIEAPLAERLGAHGRNGAVAQHPPIADDEHPVGQRLDVVHVVRRKNHGDALLAIERLDEVAQRKLGVGIEPYRRLVQEQDRGRMQQGGRDVAAHALPERKLAYRLIQQRLDLQESDELIGGRAKPALRHAIDVAQQLEAVDDGQVPPQLGALAKDDADARHVPNALAPRYEAAHLASPRRWLEDAAENFDEGRFARAVRADHPDKLAPFEREAHAIEGFDASIRPSEQPARRAHEPGLPFGHAIGLGQILDGDLRHGQAAGGGKGRGIWQRER